MFIADIYRKVVRRIPAREIPLDWDAMGYTTETFNTLAADPGFTGWPEDLPTDMEVKHLARLLDCRPGDRVLDLACGYGRHALPLALDYDLKMTGIDISPGLVAAARRMAQAAGATIEYAVGDARKIGYEGVFDGAYIAWNTFSLFSDRDVPKVLAAVRRALKPGGRFFLDLDNKDVLWAGEDSYTEWSLEGRAVKIQDACYHRGISVEASRDIYIHPFSCRVEEFILLKRLYSLAEIRGRLESNGFRVETAYKTFYGNWDPGVAFDTGGKLIVLAAKS
jgi:SAM-dependent methyltransferase